MSSTAADEDAARSLSRRDDALRRDVRLVGDALGRVLVEQVGEDLLADVERVRHLAREARNSGSAADRAALAAGVRALDEERSTAVLRAFALYFQLANVAEAWHRVRSRRRYEREQRIPRESLADARFQPGVDEFDLPARVGKLVASEVVRDHPAAVAEAEHELGVSEVGVVAHDVPEQRAPADRRHRLGEPLGERADLEAHPLAAAEDHNLHNY